jgi:gliding motility-associated-like protein
MILRKQISKKVLSFIFKACICLLVFSTPVSAQDAVWQGFVSYPSGSIKTNESTCDIIKNGELSIAPILSEQSNYRSNLNYLDTICLTKNFSIEARLKNSTSDGGLDGFDSQMSFFSNGLKTTVTLAGSAAGQANTGITIGDSICMSNNIILVTNLDDWRVVKLSFTDNVFSVTLDGIEIYKTTHARRICNLDVLKFAFNGSGKVDWVKIYDKDNTLFWKEEFSNCNTLARGIVCNPIRLDKLVTASRTCDNETLTLAADFPAMTYHWSTPSSKIDTNKTASIVKPTSGFYDLTANINACYDYFKTFEVTILPAAITNKTIRLCLGQAYALSNGKIVNIDGIYNDTLKTKMGCDSILVTNLAFDTPPLKKNSVSVCANSFILPSGKVVSTSGVHRDTSKDGSGCFMFNEITLRLGSSSSITVLNNFCEGQNFTLPSGKKVSIAGTYRDTLKTINGCDSTIVTQLSMISKPKIKFELSNTGELFEGDNVTIKAISNNGNYSWFENTLPIPRNNADIPITVKGGETVYKVVLNTAGCEVADSLKIIGLAEIKMANAFTPNNDKINDIFSITSKSEKAYKIVKFSVFNRQGNIVFNNVDNSNAWDGTHNGTELASDSYIYAIIVQSPAGKSFNFKGEVILLR